MSIEDCIFFLGMGGILGYVIGHARGWTMGWDEAEDAIMRHVRENWPEDDPNEPAEIILFPTKEAQS